MAKIPVIFTTGHVGHLHATTLDHLIHEKQIAAFRRSAGWVQVGQDPIRSTTRPMARLGNRRDDFRFKLPKP